MKKTIFSLIVASLILTSCSKSTDPFLITDTQVGNLTKEIKVKQLDSLFAQDSIVKILAKENLMSTNDQFEVYEKGGDKLLLLSAKKNEDPESKISNVQIFDERYKTDKGIHLNSTFKEITENYEVSSIANTMRSLVVSLKDTDLYFIIDKEVLSEDLKSQFGAKVETTDIPENAKIKFLMLGWEGNGE
jgi:hypothetical protein